MERYDYRYSVKEDIKTYILNLYTKEEIAEGLDTDELYDSMFISDSVTGNASGSYTFNAWTAEEYICHNFDLLAEAYEEFGGVNLDNFSAESADVTIRCYLLSGLIPEAIEEIKEEFESEEE